MAEAKGGITTTPASEPILPQAAKANSTGTIQSRLPAHTAVIHRKDEFFDVSFPVRVLRASISLVIQMNWIIFGQVYKILD